MCEWCNFFINPCNTQKDKVVHLCLDHFKIFIMPLYTILIILIVVGVLLWLVNSYIPMDRKIKNILNTVVVIAVVIWLLKAFGLFDSLKSLHTWKSSIINNTTNSSIITVSPVFIADHFYFIWSSPQFSI